MAFIVGYVLGTLSAFLILGLLALWKEDNRMKEAFTDGYCPTCYRTFGKEVKQDES